MKRMFALSVLLLASCSGASRPEGEDVSVTKSGLQTLRLRARHADIGGGVGVFQQPGEYFAFAGFVDNSVSDGCQVTRPRFGATVCRVQICPVGGPGPQPVIQAGNIHINGGATPLLLTPDADNNYAGASGTGSWFQAGELISFFIQGNWPTVPPMARILRAPPPVTLTSTVPATIDRSQGFSVTWTYPTNVPVVGTEVNTGFGSEDGSRLVTCDFPMQAGAGTIPASLLANLPAGNGYFGAQSINLAETPQPWNTTNFNLIESIDNGFAPVTLQ